MWQPLDLPSCLSASKNDQWTVLVQFCEFRETHEASLGSEASTVDAGPEESTAMPQGASAQETLLVHGCIWPLQRNSILIMLLQYFWSKKDLLKSIIFYISFHFADPTSLCRKELHQDCSCSSLLSNPRRIRCLTSKIRSRGNVE